MAIRHPRKPVAGRVEVKSEKGAPVVLGFLGAAFLAVYCAMGFLHYGIKWPLKYPDPGKLLLPAAVMLTLGAALIFIHGVYFLFILPPSAGPERPRRFFRILNWVGLLLVLGAGFVPDAIQQTLLARLGLN